jgi:NAD+ synthase/NAD+ synthase (glutamine-hydrolysing)
MKTPSVAVAQLDCVVGDISGNARRILDAAARRPRGADVLLTPELCPVRLSARRPAAAAGLSAGLRRELDALAAQVQGITVLVGYPAERAGERFNAAAVIQDGRVARTYSSTACPTTRSSTRSATSSPARGLRVRAEGRAGGRQHLRRRVGIRRRRRGPRGRRRAAAGAQRLALPHEQAALRYEVLRERIADTGLPVAYCNLVGGQDELVFDGGSFALDRDGTLAWQGASFAEELRCCASPTAPGSTGRAGGAPVEADVYDALVLGVRDYLGKNGFPAR